jgi:polar amino acid transport system permease protein
MTVANWFEQFHNATGWNFVFIYNQSMGEQLISGMLMTIKLASSCLFFSAIIGVIGAWLQSSPLKSVQTLVQSYVHFFRSTPPVVQLLFFYFGLGVYTPTYDVGGWPQPIIGNVGWAVISISLFAGAFNIEILRAGIEAVPIGTREAAQSLGYSRWQIYRQIVLPLAFRNSLPALTNNIVNLVKMTTEAYVIAVHEVLYYSAQIWSDYNNVTEMMFVLFIFFISLVSIVAWFMNFLERRLRPKGYGALS